MLDYGMPWIGGVSGSAPEFYAMIRHLYRNAANRDLKPTHSSTTISLDSDALAKLVTINIATLVIAGHHSLGELLFGIATTEKLHISEDVKGAKAYSVAASTSGFKTCLNAEKNYHFYSSDIKTIMCDMNKATGYTSSNKKTTYTTAIDDFIARSNCAKKSAPSSTCR